MKEIHFRVDPDRSEVIEPRKYLNSSSPLFLALSESGTRNFFSGNVTSKFKHVALLGRDQNDGRHTHPTPGARLKTTISYY